MVRHRRRCRRQSIGDDADQCGLPIRPVERPRPASRSSSECAMAGSKRGPRGGVRRARRAAARAASGVTTGTADSAGRPAAEPDRAECWGRARAAEATAAVLEVGMGAADGEARAAESVHTPPGPRCWPDQVGLGKTNSLLHRDYCRTNLWPWLWVIFHLATIGTNPRGRSFATRGGPSGALACVADW
jgi:hypothetical protein